MEILEVSRSLVSGTFTFRYQAILNLGHRAPTASCPAFLSMYQNVIIRHLFVGCLASSHWTKAMYFLTSFGSA